MTDVLLTVNSGSSSLKFAVYGANLTPLLSLASGHIEGLYGEARLRAQAAGETPFVQDLDLGKGPVDHRRALAEAFAWLEARLPGSRVVAVGHRIVHGGPDFVEPLRLEAAVLTTLARFSPLAPLHQPHNIAGVQAAMSAFPDAVQVGCFDTAFHRAHPFVADTFALPRALYDEGVRRYGFHGLSYEFVTRRLREIAPDLAARRVVIAHLGNGASVCATRNGRSVASTMGFTALDGLPMGSRCGQLDPGVVLYLMAEKGMSSGAISDLLYNHSGLRGLSGVSNDMRELEASSAPAAADAIAYFVSRIRREIGGLAMTLGGLEAIVFTGGIGEHSARVRADALADLDWFGIRLDAGANAANAPIISAEDSRVVVRVLPTDEERMIAEHTADIAALPRAPRAQEAGLRAG